MTPPIIGAAIRFITSAPADLSPPNPPVPKAPSPLRSF